MRRRSVVHAPIGFAAMMYAYETIFSESQTAA